MDFEEEVGVTVEAIGRAFDDVCFVVDALEEPTATLALDSQTRVKQAASMREVTWPKKRASVDPACRPQSSASVP